MFQSENDGGIIAECFAIQVFCVPSLTSLKSDSLKIVGLAREKDTAPATQSWEFSRSLKLSTQVTFDHFLSLSPRSPSLHPAL